MAGWSIVGITAWLLHSYPDAQAQLLGDGWFVRAALALAADFATDTLERGAAGAHAAHEAGGGARRDYMEHSREAGFVLKELLQRDNQLSREAERENRAAVDALWAAACTVSLPQPPGVGPASWQPASSALLLSSEWPHLFPGVAGARRHAAPAQVG